MKYWLSVALLLITSTTSEGSGLSLEEALRLATDHSYRLKKVGAEAAAAEEARRAAITERLPRLSVSAIAYRNSDVASLDIELPPPVNMNLSREVGARETYLTDIRLTLPLFTGGKISGNIELAGATVDYCKAIQKADLQRLWYQTRVEYLSLVRADRLLEAAQASLTRAWIISDDVQSLYDAGAADSVDILESRVALTEAEFKLKSAASSRRSTEIRLLTLLDLPPEDSLNPTDSPDAPGGNYQTIVQLLLPIVRPELQAAEAYIAMRRWQVSLARAEYFPSLSAYAGYSYGKPNLNLFNDEWNDNVTVGANLVWSFNIGNKTGINVKMMERYYGAAQCERDRLAEEYNREVRLALVNVNLALERYTTVQIHNEMSSDNYRLAALKHRQGVLSANRLLEIEAALSGSESSLAAALVDFYIARSALYYALGSEKLTEGF